MWSDDDTALALAWQANENANCSGCGLPRAQTMAPGADRKYWPVHSASCAACEALIAKGRTLDDSVRGSTYVWVEPHHREE